MEIAAGTQVGPLVTLIDAFGAFATVVGLIGAYLACRSMVAGDPPDVIAQWSSLGPAFGFIPGVCVSIAAYNEVSQQSGKSAVVALLTALPWPTDVAVSLVTAGDAFAAVVWP
jgi:hypothetical protein